MQEKESEAKWRDFPNLKASTITGCQVLRVFFLLILRPVDRSS